MRFPATVAGPVPLGGNGCDRPRLGAPLLAGGRAMSTTVVAPAASSSGHQATMCDGGATQVTVPTGVAVGVWVAVLVRVGVLVRVPVFVAVWGGRCRRRDRPVGVGWIVLVNMHCSEDRGRVEDHLVVAGLEAAGGTDGGADDAEGAGAGAEGAGDVRQRRARLGTSKTSKIKPQAELLHALAVIEGDALQSAEAELKRTPFPRRESSACRS